MFDIYNLYISLKGKPLTWTTLLAVIVFVIDKLQKRFIASYLRKLFNLKDTNEVRQYVENQRRIESKIDLLLKERGKEWSPSHVQSLNNGLIHSATKRDAFSWLWRRTSFTVSFALSTTKSIFRSTYMPTNKLIYLPFIAEACIIAKESWGIDIGTDEQNAIAVIVAAAIGIIGTWMDKHKKDKDKLSEAERRYLEQ